MPLCRKMPLMTLPYTENINPRLLGILAKLNNFLQPLFRRYLLSVDRIHHMVSQCVQSQFHSICFADPLLFHILPPVGSRRAYILPRSFSNNRDKSPLYLIPSPSPPDPPHPH